MQQSGMLSAFRFALQGGGHGLHKGKAETGDSVAY